MSIRKKIYWAAFYFLLSTAITWWFIDLSPLYKSLQQKLLSTGIAGAKWGLQIGAAYFLPADKKWSFIKNIGFTCIVGSVILLPYSIAALFFKIDNAQFFAGSLIVAVLVMIVLYFFSVRKSAMPVTWFWGWMFCLAIAIILQLTVVFSVIKF